MYFYLVDRRTVDAQNYEYWERLLPELRQCRVYGEGREIESDSEAIHEITKIVRKNSYRTMVAVGSDAFLATVASALIGSEIVAGYIPIADNIELARSYGLNSRPGEVGNRLAARRYQRYDLIRIGRLYVINSVHVGILDDYLRHGEEPRSWHRRLASFAKGRSDTTQAQGGNFSVKLTSAGYELTAETSGFSIFNNGWVGRSRFGDGRIDSNDGLMNIVILGKQRRLKMSPVTRDMPNIFRRDAASLSHVRLASCEITWPGEIPALVDGRPVRFARELSVEVLKSAFSLII